MDEGSTLVLIIIGVSLPVLLGAGLLLRYSAACHRASGMLIPFSGGFLLGTVGLELFPEAAKLLPAKEAFLWMLGAYLGLYIIEHFIALHACLEDEHTAHHQHDHLTTGKGVVGGGFLLHALVDGLVIGIGLQHSLSSGIIVATAVALHKLPIGMLFPCILIHTKQDERTIWKWIGALALATPVGLMGFWALARDLGDPLLGTLLALSAGSFLYISTADLLPQSHKKGGGKVILGLLLGIGATALVQETLTALFAH